MPNITLPIPETRESISRPVAMGIVKDILKRTGIPETSVLCYGYGEQLPLVNSTLTPEDQPNRVKSDNRVVIEFEEEYVEWDINSVAVSEPEHNHVFKDETLGIYIKPVYTQVELTITIQYDAPNRTKASSWGKNLKRQISQGVIECFHRINYHYPLPNSMMNMLSEFHTLRENIAGLDEGVGVWLKNNFAPNMTIISNLAGRGSSFVIKENNLRVLGWYDFGMDVPRKTKEDLGGVYRYEVQYKVLYDRPDSLNFVYPLMIHQQTIPLNFIPRANQTLKDDQLLTNYNPTLSQRGLTGFEFNNQGAYPRFADKGLAVPHFDEWLPRYTPPDYFSMIRWLMSQSPDAPTELIELTNLGEHALSEATRNYIRAMGKDILIPYRSVLYLQVYEDNDLLSADQVDIDDLLDVRLVEDANLRKSYRVVLCILTDPTSLTVAVRRKLNSHCAFLKEYLQVVLPDSGLSDQVTCTVTDAVDPTTGEDIWEKIPPEIRTRHRYPAQGIKTTQLSSIIAKRKLP